MMSIKINPYEDILFFTGKKRSGKSYAAKLYTKNVKRIIIWDYNHEHINGIITNNLIQLETLFSYFYNTHKNENVGNSLKIIYQPFTKTPEEFEKLCEWIIKNARYFMLYVEELQLVANSYNISKLPNFKQIIDVGRHQLKIGLCITTRRPHRVPTDIPENADFIFAFRQQRPEDWDYLKDYLDSELVEKLKTSPQYYYLFYDGNSGDTILKTPIISTSTALIQPQNINTQQSNNNVNKFNLG